MKADHFKKATFHKQKACEHIESFMYHLQKAIAQHNAELAKQPAIAKPVTKTKAKAKAKAKAQTKLIVESKPAKRAYNRRK